MKYCPLMEQGIFLLYLKLFCTKYASNIYPYSQGIFGMEGDGGREDESRNVKAVSWGDGFMLLLIFVIIASYMWLILLSITYMYRDTA